MPVGTFPLTPNWKLRRFKTWGHECIGAIFKAQFWKLNILDSQGWFRPDYLCLPAGMKLVPTMNTWKGIHRVFPQACIHHCLEHQVGLAPPGVPCSPSSPIILRKVRPSSWISPLPTAGFRPVLKTPERVSSSISLIEWGSKPAQELIAAGGCRKARDDSSPLPPREFGSCTVHQHCTDMKANPFCAPQAAESTDVGSWSIRTWGDIIWCFI